MKPPPRQHVSRVFLVRNYSADDGDFEVDLSYEELRSERPVKVSVFARRRTAAHADHDDDDEMYDAWCRKVLAVQFTNALPRCSNRF